MGFQKYHSLVSLLLSALQNLDTGCLIVTIVFSTLLDISINHFRSHPSHRAVAGNFDAASNQEQDHFPQADFWTGIVSEWPVIRPESTPLGAVHLGKREIES